MNSVLSDQVLLNSSERRKELLHQLIGKVKSAGKGKAYDCIVGVSGGVDSSWVLVKAVALGLRPLAVHMDNGWNSNTAVSNIANLLDKLGVDLYTYVINWNEYRSLMEAFFAADVIDVELLYDNALLEVCYSQAKKYGLRHILMGTNFSTEGMAMPSNWSWKNKMDGRNIVKIGRAFGVTLETYPLFTTWKWLVYKYLNKIEEVPLPDYLEYNKEQVLSALERDYGFTRYPYKHYESIFTRFYQGFILPRKFGVDKRKSHLSSLVLSGQMSREEAIRDLQTIPYPSEKDLRADRLFFLKKMGWGDQKLEAYLSRPEIGHGVYGTDLTKSLVIPITKRIGKVLGFFRSLKH
jgi:N-acetyl sugar amidotransferase